MTTPYLNQPTRVLYAAYVAVLIVAAVVLGTAFVASRSLQGFLEVGSRSEQLHQAIRYYDEVLTMSALTYAATGDVKWRKRYERTVPRLAEVLAEAEGHYRGRAAIARLLRVDEANQALIALEQRAFDLSTQGLRAQALAVLEGPEYARQKAVYAAGIRGLNTELLQEANAELETHRMRIVETTAFTATLTLLLLLALSRLFRDLKKQLEERERAEAELSKLALVAREIDSGVTILDGRGRIEWVNPSFSRMTGYSEAEVIGSMPSALLHGPDTSPEVAASIDQAIAKGEKISVEMIGRTKRGDRNWVELHVQPVLEGDGTVGRVVIIATDISARKCAEAEVIRTQSFLRSIVDNVPVGIWVKAVSGPDPGRFLLWNRVIERWMRLSAQDMVGHTVHELFPKDQADQLQKTDDEAIAKREPLELPLSIFANERLGPRVIRTIKIPIFSELGDADYVIGVVEDVTLRKQAEEALIAGKNHAEVANRAKSSFLATMSHEIRTPLNGIVGMVELLWEMEVSPDQRPMLNVIKDSAQALLGIVSDVLDISKIEADKLTLETVEVELEALMEGVVQMLSPLAAKKKLTLVADISASVACRVEVDPLRLQQVLFNLGSNAIKFTDNAKDKMGRVQLSVDLESAEDGRPAQIQLRVRDNGIGMSEANVQRVFEPFVQADASDTRRFGGTGLGLAIVRRLCDVAGGTVEVTSAEGHGSEFVVTWPIKVLQRHSPALVLTGVRALVIAPDTELAALKLRYLSEAGANARVLSGEGLSMLADEAMPDVVVVSQEREVLSRLRALWPQVRVVTMIRDTGERSSIPMLKNVVSCAGPLVRSRLLGAVLVATGRASPETRQRFESVPPAAPQAPSVERAEANGRLVLVVEDNDINRDVISRQLKFLGYASELANNGRDALERMKTHHYGLVLTDCHMPELDGFELTRDIRENEGEASRIPIVAITANAMSGEAERCKQAGMDDWLAKPVALVALRATLERWLPRDPKGAFKALDPEVLAELLGGDSTLNTGLFRRFVTHAREAIGEIVTASASGNARAAMEQAHKLKSSSASVGARFVASLSAQIEAAAGADNLAELALLCPQLESEMRRVESDVGRMPSSASSPPPG